MTFDDYGVPTDAQLPAEATAVLVVDMLNDFVRSSGAMHLLGADQIIGAIAAVLDDARDAGARIVHVQEGHWPDDGHFVKRTPACLFGTWGHEIVDELAPQKTDHVSPKRRYSAFFATDLDLRLREWGVENVVVTGVTTNICVRATVHDAHFLGYQVVVPADCVHAPTTREQESTLHDIRTHFGSVTTAATVRELLSARVQGAGRV